MGSRARGAAQATRTLRLVLGDQLSPPARLSSLRDLDPASDVVLMAEVTRELTYAPHHKQKIVQTLASMRLYAARLREAGVRVRYVRHDDPDNAGDLPGEVLRALRGQAFDRVVMTASGEWRLEAAFDALQATMTIPLERREDDRFLCSRDAFYAWSRDKALRMEFFYRQMRRKTGVLMEGDAPAGGRWNFDAENRKRPPRGLQAPARLMIEPNATVRALCAEVKTRFPDNFGSLDAFSYAVTPEDAERLAAHFFAEILPGFGDYQDYMAPGEPWLWHARISAALNIGFLDPLDLCRRAEAEWAQGRAPINAVEGFIRQILGWREFVRGVYWLKGPDYKAINALDADRELPSFYWTAETEMACVRDAVENTRDHAYAHHIQRLMVTGNLAMLLGVHPDAVNEWYLAVYADAYEWVELPNTHGMALFADGGIMGSKPYAASGAYIDRMSRYCEGCAYDVRERLAPNACPFNSLYWDFLARNARRLAANPRIGPMYRTLEKMTPEMRDAITAKAEAVKEALGATLQSQRPTTSSSGPAALSTQRAATP